MYNICIIDDALQSPCVDMEVDVTKPMCEFTLKHILKSSNWSDKETQTKSLIDELSKKSEFSLKGYSNPEFFDNDTDYFPDVVIFDWDYNSQAKKSEQYLMNIVKNKFCMVFIYTGYEKKYEIKTIINGISFIEFKNRIHYFEKEDKSVKSIEDKINKLKQNNFSFKFGKKIRLESQKSVENILVNLGKIDIEKAQRALNITGSNSRDLIEFIGERYKNLLLSIDFSGLELVSEETEAEQTVTEERESQHANVQSELSDLWKYRLYFDSKDKVVRKGDIIKWDLDYYLVLTPDCDLFYFWNKTLGYLNIVPLLDTNKDKETIKKLFSITKPINNNFRKNIKKITSISNALSSVGSSLFLPFINETNFFLFPKMITSKKVDMPIEISSKGIQERAQVPLMIDMVQNATKITTLSEPFLTAVIEHIFTELKGYGSPDYNEDMIKELTENAKGVFKSDS